MTGASAFRLEKWYCDWTGPDGSAAIGYWASLRWRGLALSWQQLTHFPAAGAVRERSHLPGDAPPAAEGSRVTWRPETLGLTYEAERTIAPIGEVLLEQDGASVAWEVVAPAARVRYGSEREPARHGTGYAERLTLSIAPWALPLRELRWGRWISGDASRSLVWIDWGGPLPRSWVYLDGVRLSDAVVNDAGVVAPGLRLTLAPRRSLVERRFADVIARIPPLVPLVPERFLGMREHKQLSAGTLHLAGHDAPVPGDALHEVVVLP